MTIAANLPHVIADKILKELSKCGPRTSQCGILKLLFPFLAVCRAWREVGIPFLYKSTFLYYVDQNGIPLKCENFLLAKENGLIHYVKKIELSIDAIFLPNTTFEYLEEIFNIEHVPWYNARQLELSVTNNTTLMSGNISTDRMHSINNGLDNFSKRILHALPNIQSIKLSSFSSERSISQETVGNLLLAYRSSLLTFDFDCCTVPRLNVQMDTLTKLVINRCTSYRLLLSQINCNILESLIIYNLEQPFIWDAFVTANPYEIHFNRLHTLQIQTKGQLYFNNLQNLNDMHVYNIYLPCLKKFEIFSFPSKVIEKTKLYFPKHMSRICITDTPAIMSLIAGSAIQTIKRIDVTLTQFFKDISVENLYNWSNILFGNHFQVRRGKLSIGNSSISLSIENAQWTNLTHLQWQKVEFFTLIKFITKQTQLRSIHVNECIFEHIPPNIKDYVSPQKHSKSQLTNLRSNIKKVIFYKISNLGCDHNDIFMCLQLLTLLLNSLNRFYIMHTKQYNWNLFVEVFKQWYPHLVKLEIEARCF